MAVTTIDLGSVIGPQGPQGPKGDKGDKGDTSTASDFKLAGYNRGTTKGNVAATDNILTAVAKLENRITDLENEIKNLIAIQ